MSSLYKRCPRCRGTGEIATKKALARVALPFGPKETRAQVKAKKQAAHRMSTADVVAAVLGRADGVCECGCGRIAIFSGELDHRWGGVGRRREAQSVETCWILRRKCHFEKTANFPSAAAWQERWAAHCKKYGYTAERPALRARFKNREAF